MSLSTTKDTYKDNISDDIFTFITTFTDDPKLNNINIYARQYSDMLAKTIMDNCNAWLEANKKAVKTDTKPAEPHFHLEAESATSGLKFD